MSGTLPSSRQAERMSLGDHLRRDWAPLRRVPPSHTEHER